jgi:hypothetical protein
MSANHALKAKKRTDLYIDGMWEKENEQLLAKQL